MLTNNQIMEHLLSEVRYEVCSAEDINNRVENLTTEGLKVVGVSYHDNARFVIKYIDMKNSAEAVSRVELELDEDNTKSETVKALLRRANKYLTGYVSGDLYVNVNILHVNGFNETMHCLLSQLLGTIYADIESINYMVMDSESFVVYETEHATFEVCE